MIQPELPPLPRKRILIVEERPDVASDLAAPLEARGYEVHVECEGREALVDASVLRPDLVILDLELPDMDGYQVSRRLRSLYRAWILPILMLIAPDQPLERLRSYGAGADACLPKPCDQGELLGTVERLLDEGELELG